MSQSLTTGPLTIISGAVQCVVDCISPRSNAGWSIARIAATTTVMWSGRQPAIAALVAIFSIVAAPPPGPIAPRSRSASRPEASTSRATRSCVGMTTGSPSVAAALVEDLERLGLVGRGEHASRSAHGALLGSLSGTASPRSTATMRAAIPSATRPIASCPLPATGCGRRSRGMSGMPADAATESPCNQNCSVTRATAALPRRATSIPSRTVPEVQLPQWP